VSGNTHRLPSGEVQSLYFPDPNGHKLEIHVSDLAARIKSAKE
jgi:hypothetical protein